MQPWCTFCGARDDLTTDHLVPLAKGGTRRPTIADVLVLCRGCNARKGDRAATFEQMQLAGLTRDGGVPPRADTRGDPASQPARRSLTGAGWPLEAAG